VCGIAGIVALHERAVTPTREELTLMAGALRHRGPDEFGLYRDARAGLAHARLSIVDLSTGQQPLSNEDGSLWIAFNGEIFNYVELRAELVELGHSFRTRSDTEVIVHAYEAWGNDAFERMNGQWAVALWNERTHELVLARDRVGVRPLFLCEHAGRLYFASEVKAIFAADASITRALDPVGLAQTFTFWSTVAPAGVFVGVSELAPGHVRTYSRGTVREHVYWRQRYPEIEGDPGSGFSGSLEDATVAVRSTLGRAVELRMVRADVPVGSYLSGGLDSALVAALARRFAGDRFRTFSLRFEDAEYDETEFQRLMVQELDSEHHEIVVSRREIARVFPDVVFHTERPILRTAPAPLFLLSQLVRDHGIKVVLTGEGADEMFAGYDLFREGKVRRFWAKQPLSERRPRLLERLYPYLARSPVSQQAMARQFFGTNLAGAALPGFAHETRWRTTGALRRLFSPTVRERLAGRDLVAELLATLPEELSRWTPLSQDQHLEVRTLLSGYLLSSQGDRMLMAHSVEGRFPFLDRELIALADSLPATYKLRGLDEKHVLKRVARGLVPERIIRRPKQPYRAPDALSFSGADRPAYCDELLSADAVKDAGTFDPRAVTPLWSKCRARPADQPFSNTDNMALVGLLSTQLLHYHFVARRPKAAPISLRTDVDRLR